MLLFEFCVQFIQFSWRNGGGSDDDDDNNVMMTMMPLQPVVSHI